MHNNILLKRKINKICISYIDDKFNFNIIYQIKGNYHLIFAYSYVLMGLSQENRKE